MSKRNELDEATIAAFVEWQELMARLGVASYNWVLARGESVMY